VVSEDVETVFSTALCTSLITTAFVVIYVFTASLGHCFHRPSVHPSLRLSVRLSVCPMSIGVNGRREGRLVNRDGRQYKLSSKMLPHFPPLARNLVIIIIVYSLIELHFLHTGIFKRYLTTFMVYGQHFAQAKHIIFLSNSASCPVGLEPGRWIFQPDHLTWRALV